MNERIRQLAEQAGYTKDMFGVGHWDMPECKKFAQLIVQECVKLCKHESNDDEYDQYDMGQSVKAENIKASIMKEFGVEER